MKLFNDVENKRIECKDERYYEIDGNYYPSVTTVLDAYPKGERFNQWLKDLGNNAQEVLERAGEQGSNVHSGIEKLLKGFELNFDEYTLDEWKMILKFKDFYDAVNPQLEAIEHNLVSKLIGVGGTIDLVCSINSVRWLIDFKTSSAIYDNHYVQLATYAAMWNEAYPDQRIEKIACLHLRASTKTKINTSEKIQGIGWKLDEPSESPSELFEIFKHVKAMWHRLNPHARPINLVFPASLKLEKIETKKTPLKKELPF